MSILFSGYMLNTLLGDFINIAINSIPSFVPVLAATVTLVGVLVVARMSGSREDEKIRISKQSNPPNLVLYKVWLEISEKYIDLAGHKSVYGLTLLPEEYRNIEAARKGALASLKWEREIENLCSDSVVKPYISNIRQGLAEKILSYKYSAVYLLQGDYFRPPRFKKIWYAVLGILGIVDIPYIIFFLDMNPFFKFLNVILIVFCFYALYLVRFKFLAYYEVHKSDYWFRLIVVRHYKKRLWVDYFAELDLRKERLRSAALLGLPDGYAGLSVYCPWEGKPIFFKILSRFWTVVHPGYYAKRVIPGEENQAWGAYKNGDLNGYIPHFYGIPDDCFLFNLEQASFSKSPSVKSISEMFSRPASRHVPQALRNSVRAPK
ncbi:hypothetical protein [Rothia mucilaginosa]|uniref:hypothetical protein n=1 Tax=Rothia mucilaginosa TaxID=43675 RepID=UPI0028E35698|nr:hypothetical protein [Rothia mucilaginosa]